MELLQPGTMYHIYNHANGFENLFREKRNYTYFLSKYEEYIVPVAETYSYCLMPNHFHLLLKIKSEGELPASNVRAPRPSRYSETLKVLERERSNTETVISNTFSNFFNSYTKSFNKMYNRKGSLFVPRFKRKPILTMEQFLSTFTYIHLNPVKHGFTQVEEEWLWSSLHCYSGKEESMIICKEKPLDLFGGYASMVTFLNERRERIIDLMNEF